KIASACDGHAESIRAGCILDPLYRTTIHIGCEEEFAASKIEFDDALRRTRIHHLGKLGKRSYRLSIRLKQHVALHKTDSYKLALRRHRIYTQAVSESFLNDCVTDVNETRKQKSNCEPLAETPLGSACRNQIESAEKSKRPQTVETDDWFIRDCRRERGPHEEAEKKEV